MFKNTFNLFKLSSRDQLIESFSVYARNRNCERIMRILNVAEKNDAAKNIAACLSGGTACKKEGISKFNKIYEFETVVCGEKSKMIMTSVSGHLLQINFEDQYRVWAANDISVLFDAPLKIECLSQEIKRKKFSEAESKLLKAILDIQTNQTAVKKTLQREIKTCEKLIIWTDCDREGERIGFEIIEVCKEVKPNFQVFRAKFSEITSQSVTRALTNLQPPNKNLNDAVKVRQELDLRIGAVFSRLQTKCLQRAFPQDLNNKIISYGTCQFPTLGFVVERFKEISEFVPEKFWEVNVNHTLNDLTVSFFWERHRLFDKSACQVLYDVCKKKNKAVVERIECKPKQKWRPKPLDTVEFEKLASIKLHINPKEALKIAEKLYTQGLISYPRTETNIFPKEINLTPIVEIQTESPLWGAFAQRVLNEGPKPFQGKKSDQAHPPIYPTKYSSNLQGNEKKIYEFIVRHFLACVSKHAEGQETTVVIDISNEKFVAKGLMITARNYLEVYPYDKWSDKELHLYKKGDIFVPEILMNEGETSPPKFLTEADLITLMEKHGIGTDATHAEHIETIKSRMYVGMHNNNFLVPRTLGMGLVEGYISMGFKAMAEPKHRADLEADLKKICENKANPEEVLRRHIEIYKKVFEGVKNHLNELLNTIKTYVQFERESKDVKNFIKPENKVICKCPSCNSNMIFKLIKSKKNVISCMRYPSCKESIWLPSFVLDIVPTEKICQSCQTNSHLLKFKFDKTGCYFPSDYVGCITCDINLRDVLGLSYRKRRRSPEPVEPFMESINNEINDSGFGSMNESPSRIITNTNFKKAPLCHCGKKSIHLTVKKDGPNFGRKFFKCGSSTTIKCNFFEWEKNISLQISSNTVSNRNYSTQNTSPGENYCYCAIQCKRSTVQKEGPNKGRDFYNCGKPFQDSTKCNFFKWVENDENSFEINS